MMRIRAKEVRKITMKVMDCSMKSGVAGDGCIDKNPGEVWEKGTAKLARCGSSRDALIHLDDHHVLALHLD
jgi:hypothetical protein